MSPTAADPIVAVDLGGTRMRASTFKSGGAIEHRLTRPTPVDGGPDAVVEALAALVEAVLGQATDPLLAGARVVLSATGPIDADGGWVDPTNLGGRFYGYPLGSRLADRLRRPVLVGLDTRLALLGELRAGGLRGHRDGVFVTVSTGVGGAFLVDGRVVGGAHGVAGEVGHLPVMAGGPRCGCGGHGHLEAVASGLAMARAATLAARRGRSPALARRLREVGRDGLTGADVAAAAADGDPAATAILRRARHALAVAVVGLVNILDPTCVVLGGGVILAEPDAWIGSCRTELEQAGLATQRASVEIVVAELDDDAGLVGCLDHERLGARWIEPPSATRSGR